MGYIKRKGLLMLIWLVVCIIVFNNVVYAADLKDNPNKKGIVTVIVLDKVSLSDMVQTEVPNIMTLIDRGAVGLMTTNPAARASRIPQNTYATIGAGAKIQAGSPGGLAFNESEIEPDNHAPAALEYEVRTGIKPEPGSVVHLGIAQIWNLNKDLKYNFVVGGLGTAMHEGGLKTAVIGNSDTNEKFFRQVVTIAMDKDGMVDYGDVSSRVLKKDRTAVYNKRTDIDKVMEIYRELRTKAGLVVIDFGDSSRLDQASNILLPEVLEDKKRTVLKNADILTGLISAEQDFATDLLILVTPGPSSFAMEQRNYLTPVIIAGKGVKNGILTSATTKRPGLINNTDILPTILQHFQLPLDIPFKGQGVAPNGLPVQVQLFDETVPFLLKMNEEIVGTFNARIPLVKTFINSELIIILAAVVAIFMNVRVKRLLQPFLMAITAMPLALLLQYFIPQETVFGAFLIVLLITVLITVGGYLVGYLWNNKIQRAFSFIGLLTAAIIAVDLLTGGILNKNSPLSYDPMSGARFYGIGNEYMGVFIGALLMGLGTMSEKLGKFRKWGSIGLLIAMIAIMAAPDFGTNVGGTIAGLFALVAVSFLFAGIKPKLKIIFAGFGGIGAILVGFLFFEMNRSPEAQSHIGRTMVLLSQGGLEEALNIAARKWEVNWRLIRGTTWSWAYFSGLVSVFLLWHWMRDRMQALKDKNPVYFIFLTGIIAASIGALLFNDSGVVAAATMIIYGVAPLYYLIIGEKDSKP